MASTMESMIAVLLWDDKRNDLSRLTTANEKVAELKRIARKAKAIASCMEHEMDSDREGGPSVHHLVEMGEM